MMIGQPYSGKLNVRLDERREDAESRCLPPTPHLNAYVGSQRAGEDVMETLRRLYAGLRLRINEARSAVARPEDRKLPGYSFFDQEGTVKLCATPKALAAMKERVREIVDRTAGRSIPTMVEAPQSYLPGWKDYFRLADTPRVFHNLDAWIRRRLRMVHLKQWKQGPTVFRELRARGLSIRAAAEVAAHCRRWWRTAGHVALHTALPNRYFDRIGVPRPAS